MENIFNKNSSSQWQNDIYTIWELTKKHFLRLITAVVCSLFLSSINGVIAWLVKPAFDNLFDAKNRTLLYFLPFGVFLLFVLRGFFTFCNNYLMNSIGAKIAKSLRQAFFEKIIRLSMAFHSQKSSGSLISRLINDIQTIEILLPATARNFLVQSTSVILLTFVALYRRWDLALLSFFVIPFVAIVSSRFGKKMKSTSTNTRKLISTVTKIFQETLSGIKVIKLFTMENEMARHNNNAVAKHYKNIMREVKINELTAFFMEIIAGFGIALTLWYGSYLIINNKLSGGAFFSFVVAILMIYTPLKRLSRVNNDFQKVRTALHRIKEIFYLEDEEDGRFEKKDMDGHIIFDNVSFCYPESKEEVLRNVKLEIFPGETVAIVGYSGSGKSTLADLLLGFWKNYTGEILIDKVSIKNYSLRNLRSYIGVVSQDIILFNDTVKNNILFGKPDATDEEVEEAAKAAYVHDFVNEMPKGYDTCVGEDGIRLSGGQKQRISLARAIIKNPKILLLDEATSSLDTDSETKIQKALESIMAGRTTIIIAHRLSTIKKADRILVMDKGKIIQEGKHFELFSQGGTYQDLYNLSIVESTQ